MVRTLGVCGILGTGPLFTFLPLFKDKERARILHYNEETTQFPEPWFYFTENEKNAYTFQPEL